MSAESLLFVICTTTTKYYRGSAFSITRLNNINIRQGFLQISVCEERTLSHLSDRTNSTLSILQQARKYFKNQVFPWVLHQQSYCSVVCGLKLATEKRGWKGS